MDPVYSCLIPGNSLNALWEWFSRWRSDLHFKREGTVLRAEYLSELNLTKVDVRGQVWLERLLEWRGEEKVRVVWLGSATNRDFAWTSGMLERNASAPPFGQGPNVHADSHAPFDQDLRAPD